MALLLYWTHNDGRFGVNDFYLLLFQVVILTILIPISFFFLLKSLGKVDNIMIANKSQRILPLIIHIILLLILLKRSQNLENYPELYYFFIGSIFSTFLALFLIFMGHKASLHLIGISALVVFVIELSLYFEIRMLLTIISLSSCIGLVASSRLEMKAHNSKELTLGFLVGIMPQLILFYFWK